MASRYAYQAGIIAELGDLAAAGEPPTGIVNLRCPACRGPVYVPGDSDRELVQCAASTCSADLVTRRDIAGVVSLVELDIGGSS
jgi:hypothetical protein